jgi:hypothetical protein
MSSKFQRPRKTHYPNEKAPRMKFPEPPERARTVLRM